MQLFYHPDIEPLSLLVTFSKEESRHLVKVLRKKRGDQIHITDGRGNLYLAEVISDNDKKCEVQVLKSETKPDQKGYRLHIAIAPTKNNDRFEWFLEKSTEIGIDEITPILCDRSERKKINHERCQKVLLAAMKQSLKFSLPTLNPLQRLDDHLKGTTSEAKLIAHCTDIEKKDLSALIENKNEILVLIGPEGDFSPREIEEAMRAGYVNLDLGKTRLRTETAGVVVCSNISFMKEFS